MTINTRICKQKITYFNSENIKGVANFVDYNYYPIELVIYNGGSTSVIRTHMVTTNINMKGTVFSDEDKTEIENIELTLQLKKLIQSCWEYVKEHITWHPRRIREGLVEVVRGGRAAYNKDTIIGYIYDKVIPMKDTKSTCEKYATTAKHIRDFDDCVTFKTIDKFWLKDFERYLKNEKKMALATISIQLRNLRSVINQAIADEDTDIRSPFVSYKIPRKTIPAKPHLVLSAQQFADFRDYPVEPWQQRYKDFCLLSFYLGGINPVDILTLPSLTAGRVVTTRKKTGGNIDLPVCTEALEIINKYKGEKTLVSFAEHHKDIHNFIHDCDEALKKIGYMYLVPDKRGTLQAQKRVPMFPDMTIYTFRRSFATICAELDVPTENIALAMAHKVVSPFTITEVYIVRSKRKTDNAINTLVEHLRTLKGRSKDVIDAELRSTL